MPQIRKYSPVEKCLKEMFEPDWLRKKAQETGFIKRERKIDPVSMFWVLVLGFSVRLRRSIASLKRDYEKNTESPISDGSWYPRFAPELVAFLKECVIYGIQQLEQKDNRKLNKKLSTFSDILIQDSTIIRLHDSLSKKFPAARTRKVAAGCKVSMLVSAVADGPKRISIYNESRSEIKTLKLGPWIKNRILLTDLGFFKYASFVKIEEYEGFFVSRLKGNANPLITGVNKVCRGRSIDVIGKKIKDVLPKLKREILDVNIQVNFNRRKYKNMQKKDDHSFRLVAIYNKEEEKYHAYITNITPETLCAEDIASLYGCRWDIELIFKELKSHYALDVIDTKNPQIIESYIWVSLLTLLVSRKIYNLVRSGQPKVKMPRFTHLKWSKVFAENATGLLMNILAYCDVDYGMMTFYDIYGSQAFDTHVNRERLTDKWWS